MIRFRRLLAIIVVVACASAAAGQGQLQGGRGGRGALPGGRGGAQRPGMPPRDPVDRAMPVGTGTLRGRVVAENGQPIRRAQVRAFRTGAATATTVAPGADGVRQARVTPSVVSATTDGDGRWQMQNLPAGEFEINATKAGYVNASYGQQAPQDPGKRVSLAAGQMLDKIDLIMPRGGVVAGRISDEYGEPLANAQIQVQRYQYGPGGTKQLMFAQSGVQGQIMTDDLGQFRVFGLMPGEYVVSASIRSLTAGRPNADDGDRDGYPPTFYPGTPNVAEATTVTIGAGEEAALQFSLQPARLARISGRVLDSQGRPAANAVVMLSSGNGATVNVNGGGQVRGDGTFVLNGVPPGEHALVVRPQPRNVGDEPEFASVPLMVGGDDITDIAITTSRGVTLRGRLVFEGAAQRPTNTVRVAAQPTDVQRVAFAFAGNDQANGVVGADGTFQVRAGFGKVLFRAAAQGWTLKSVTLDGQDVTDVPTDVGGGGALRIVLTDKTQTVSGTVESRNQPSRGSYVVIQPEDDMVPLAAQRYSRIARPDDNGRYTINGLPPGRYVAAAVESLSQGVEWSPVFRQMLLGSGESFTLTEGQTLALNLRLRPAP
jgi:protocatechuate 3,4-dioxygenase beta subunit